MTLPMKSTSKIRRKCGELLVFSTVISFLFVGFIINILQVLVLISFHLSHNWKWRAWHKRVNGYLLHALMSPPIFLLYYWNNFQLRAYLEDMKLIEETKKDLLAILIPNHSYEVDYMICFVMSDQLGKMGNYKSFSKAELKWLPVVGWALWMSDIIFVRRDWSKDSESLEFQLNKLFDYEQILLGIFAEGTRWTPEKHKLSVEFAKSRGLEPLEHHLMPRPRGFNYTIRHLWREIILNKRKDEKLFRLLNLQIILPEKLDYNDFIQGNHMVADVYVEEVELTKEHRAEVLASRNENDCPKLTQLLRDIYKRKDELVNEYQANGKKFKPRAHGRAGYFPYAKGKMSILIWSAGMLFTYSTLIYLATSTVCAHSITFWSTLIGFISSCWYMFGRIERESRIMSERTSTVATIETTTTTTTTTPSISTTEKAAPAGEESTSAKGSNLLISEANNHDNNQDHEPDGCKSTVAASGDGVDGGSGEIGDRVEGKLSTTAAGVPIRGDATRNLAA